MKKKTIVGALALVLCLVIALGVRCLTTGTGSHASPPDRFEPVATGEGVRDLGGAKPSDESGRAVRRSMDVAEAAPEVAPEPAELRSAVLMDLRGRALAGVRLESSSSDGPFIDGDTLREGNHGLVIDDSLRRLLSSDPSVADQVLFDFQDKAAAKDLILRPNEVRNLLRTAADGSFEYPLQHDVLRLLEDRLFLVASADLLLGERDVRVFIATTKLHLAGRVLDQDGKPIRDASVRVGVQQSRLDAFPHELRQLKMLPAPHSVKTDQDGRYDLVEVPLLPGGQLVATQRRHRAAYRELPAQDDLHFDLSMARSGTRHVISGHVIAYGNKPAAGARVQLGHSYTVADVDGSFQIELSNLPLPAHLLAYLEGFQPAFLENLGQKLMTEGDQKHLVLRLGPESLSLSGQVHNSDGSPKVGAEVYLADATRPGSGSDFTVEQDLATTDESGSFALSGLSHRHYSLRVVDRKTLVSVEAGPFLAGSSNVQVVFPSTEPLLSIHGRVVSEAGHPMSKVHVNIFTRLTGDEWSQKIALGGFTFTDAQGWFRLDNVPGRGARLTLRGEHLDQVNVDLAEYHLAEPLELTVEAYVSYLIQCPQPDQATRLGFRNAGDDPVRFKTVTRKGVEGRFSGILLKILDPEQPFRVSERATQLVFSSGDQELRRVALPPCPPGGIKLIR